MTNFGFLFLCCSLVNPESDLKLEGLFFCGTLYRFLEELEQKVTLLGKGASLESVPCLPRQNHLEVEFEEMKELTDRCKVNGLVNCKNRPHRRLRVIVSA
ncbi:unnamed protein product [Arabidopsis lyrata]|nr:unnamed protein product [Arabidopsis lyrata]